MADYTITTTDLSGSIDGAASGVVITVVTGVTTGGGGGAVDSVNGHTGVVVLAASDVGAVPTSRTVNGKALSANVTLSASDVSADASGAAASAQTAAQSYADTNKLAKSANLSDVANAGTSRTNLGLGTAAVKDVPATGNASTSQVVYGTDTRLSDARTPTSHTHAESDVTGLVTDLAGKVPTTRTVAGHALSADVTLSNTDISGLGTASTKDVPASGNATSTQVVKGDDTRLTDSRNPTAHASTHASAGTDPITIAESQVTNLTTDLAAKAPLASPTFTGTPAAPTATAGTNTTQLATTAFVTTAVAGGGGGGMTDPTTTKGDLIVHGTSTTRLPVGSNNQVLTADSTQTLGVKWAAAAGSAWTQQINLALSTLTGWTAGTGTWSASTGVIQETATSGSANRLYYSTPFPQSAIVMQCDLRVDTASSTNHCGFTFGGPLTDANGGLEVGFKASNSTNVDTLYTEYDGLSGGASLSITPITNGTWVTFKIVKFGTFVDVWLNGTYTAGFNIAQGSVQNSRFALKTSACAVSFRNLTLYIPTWPI